MQIFSVGYIEIYNEKVYDLLTDRKQVQINQNGDNDVKLTNKEVIVKDGETILNILAIGNKLRKAAQTNMNEASSRSHAIFRIVKFFFCLFNFMEKSKSKNKIFISSDY